MRVPLNCWYPNNKERVLLVAQFRPNHHIKVKDRHYLSPEAYAEPIAELRMLSKEVEFNNAVIERPSQIAQLIQDVKKALKKHEQVS